MALPGHLEHVDSMTEENGHTSLGQAIYFDWYNHYCTLVSLFTFRNIYYEISLQGNGTPHNIHPDWLKNVARKYGVASQRTLRQIPTISVLCVCLGRCLSLEKWNSKLYLSAFWYNNIYK